MMKKDFLLKKIASIAILVVALSLSACGEREKSVIETGAEQEKTQINDTVLETAVSEATVAEESTDYNELSEERASWLAVPVNTEEKEVLFHSKDGIHPARAIHRCQSDDENVYLAYGEPDLYVMTLGADEHQKVKLDNPERLDVCSVALDVYGTVYLLMGSDDDEEWYIWQLDKDYQVIKMFDISGYFEKKQMPNWFLIDKDGNFYLQWLFERDGILVDREGNLKNRFTLESLEIGWTYEAAVGKDGAIYLVYEVEKKNFEVGRLNTESCSIENGVSMPELRDSSTFSEMSAGTDTNLLLYSPMTGAWAIDIDSGVIENRVPVSDIDFGKNIDFWPLTFLADGRLLLAGAGSQGGVAEGNDTEICTLQYIPVGR